MSRVMNLGRQGIRLVSDETAARLDAARRKFNRLDRRVAARRAKHPIRGLVEPAGRTLLRIFMEEIGRAKVHVAPHRDAASARGFSMRFLSGCGIMQGSSKADNTFNYISRRREQFRPAHVDAPLSTWLHKLALETGAEDP